MNIHSEIKEMAYSYLSLDLPIIPLCSYDHRGCSEKHKSKCMTPGKAPTLPNWSKHKSTDEDDLDEWFQFNRFMNIGLVLGQTSSYNLLGIDIDGELGEQTFQNISKDLEVPPTWEFTSGNGRRLLYNLPKGLQTKKHRVVWQEGHEELAFMAQGQQTVFPPSMHSNGNLYTWIDDCSPFERDIADAPDWMIARVKIEGSSILTDEMPEDLPPGLGGKVLDISTPVVAEESMMMIGEGGRSNQLTRLVGSLCAKRVLSKEVILATALQQNKLYCNPPLAESEIQSMVETIYNSEMEKHQKFLKKQRRKQELNPTALTNTLMTQLNNAGIFWKYHEKQGRMYRTEKTKGPWVATSREALNAEIHAFLSEQDDSLATTGLCSEIYQQSIIWSTQHYGSGIELDLGEHPYTDYIAIKNGILDWKNKKLLPWDITYNHTTMIEAEWTNSEDMQVAKDLWNKALHAWIDSEETIMFLQEYIGYALLPSNKMRTAVFLYGEGKNGKSLFIDAVSSLFASTSVTTQPATLATRFGTNDIVDKLLLICSDIDSTYLERTGVLKQLIAGDYIRAEIKGGKSFQIKPTCKLLFSANKLPKSADKSVGWYSRLKLVPFNHMFKEDARYYMDFVNTMCSEAGKSYLLQWAVEGLIRLHKNNCWTTSEELVRTSKEYQEENDNVQAFVSHCLEPSPIQSDGYKTALMLQPLYLVYKDWCDDMGVKSVSQSNFTQGVKMCHKVKSLRWKVQNRWKNSNSVLNVCLTDEDLKYNYSLFANTAT